MTDRDPTRPDRFETDDIDREQVIDETVIVSEANATDRPIDDRGGFRDTAPNPHDEEGTGQTAARAGGAMAGMFFPVIIVAIVAIVVILFFVL